MPSDNGKNNYKILHTMKKGIHPENYRLVVFKDMSNGTTTITKSTAATKETIEIDGVEYPLVKMEISIQNYRTFLLIKMILLRKQLINITINQLELLLE